MDWWHISAIAVIVNEPVAGMFWVYYRAIGIRLGDCDLFSEVHFGLN